MVLAMTMSAAPARSADRSDPPPNDAFDPTGDEAYRKAILDGVSEYDAGRFEEARSIFRRAHALSPNARTLRGIGMASFELRDYVAAVHYLSASLQDKRKPLSSEQRKSTQGLLDRSLMFVDVYRVRLVPPTAHLRVDGKEPTYESDGTLILGMGPHRFEADALGMIPLSQSIDARGGARRELWMTLETAPRPVAQPSDATETEEGASLPAEVGSRSRPVWLLAGAAASVLLAGGAGYYGYQRHSELTSCRENEWVGNNAGCTTKRTLTWERNVAVGVAIGAGATAVTLALVSALTWNRKEASEKQETAFRCTMSPYAIVCGGSF